MRSQISCVAVVLVSLSGSAWGGTIYSNNFDGTGTNDNGVLAPGVSGGFVSPFTASTTAVSAALTGLAHPGPGGAGAFSGRLLSHNVFSGPGSSNRLVLTNLPSHTSVSIGFLAAMFDRWKTADTVFQVSVGDGVTSSLAFSSGFDNSSNSAGYTSNRIVWGASLGGAVLADAAYDLSLESSLQNIPHTSSTLTVMWTLWVPGLPTGNIHTYGLDNLTITTDGGPVIPLPHTGGMALAGLGLLAMRRRRV